MLSSGLGLTDHFRKSPKGVAKTSTSSEITKILSCFAVLLVESQLTPADKRPHIATESLRFRQIGAARRCTLHNPTGINLLGGPECQELSLIPAVYDKSRILLGPRLDTIVRFWSLHLFHRSFRDLYVRWWSMDTIVTPRRGKRVHRSALPDEEAEFAMCDPILTRTAHQHWRLELERL